MSDHPYIDIEVEGKTTEEVLDAIYKAREGFAPMWWPELRLLAGRLREPLEIQTKTGVKVVRDVPAGATFFGVLVV